MNDQAGFALLEESFHQLEALDPKARDARLLEISRRDPSLHKELIQLLDPATRAKDRVEELDRLARDLLASGEDAGAKSGFSPGDRVGPYRLVRLLGIGGMGQVFEAEQTHPVERRVALKVIAESLASTSVVARFEAERQALAVMDHPHIARVFELGSQNGLPWFAMELVNGIPITEWAERHKLSVRERIELLVPICDAVQHAHLKGVIHRDLKPSNLLISEVDGEPIAKVIDFGIAKAIDRPIVARTLATRLGELVGTPEYMSPEQATLGAIDIDTRSDVFSLGLVLYELLVGELPLRREELRGVAFDEVCRRIREDATPRPSQRLARRQRSAAKTYPWWRDLRGDLDAVLQKALSKDRERRYASAAGFADDLRHYLHDQPISASAPSWSYRARKFTRRNRLLVVAGTAIALALVFGVLLAGLGFMEARRSQEEAVAATREARSAQRTAEATSDFLVELFRSSDPRENPGLEMTAGQLLDIGVERIDKVADEPEVQARLLETLGDVSWALGAFDRAEPLLLRAIELRREGRAAAPVRLAFLLDRLGGLKRDRSDLVRARALHLEALEILDAAGFGESEDAGRVYNNLGIVLRRSQFLEEAASAYEEAIRLAELHNPEPTGDVAAALVNLAAVYQEGGEVAKALTVTERAFGLFVDLLPEGHPHFGTLHNNLAVMHLKLGAPGAAAKHASKGLTIDRQALPAEHPIIADDLLCVGRVALRLGRFDQARATFGEALEIQSRALGEDHFRVHHTQAYLGALAWAERDAQRAEVHFKKALSILENSQQLGISTQKLRVELPWLSVLRHVDAAEARRRAEGVIELAEQLEDPNAIALTKLQLALTALDLGDERAASEAWQQATHAAGCDNVAEEPCSLDGSGSMALRAHWWARRGDAQRAFKALRLALDHPLWEASLLNSPDLEYLQGDERWKAIVHDLAKRLEE